ncbi:unnamed protein product, partial [Larinioides sclopetarius]
ERQASWKVEVPGCWERRSFWLEQSKTLSRERSNHRRKLKVSVKTA